MKILPGRASKVVDLARWRVGKKSALEIGIDKDGLAPSKFAGLEPCHAVYALAENLAPLMAEAVSGMSEAKSLCRPDRTASSATD